MEEVQTGLAGTCSGGAGHGEVALVVLESLGDVRVHGGTRGGRVPGGNGGQGQGVSGGQIAKQVAKIVAKEIGAAASDEAKELGLAAGHKAMELGERRRQRRASKHNATAAALRKADEAGVDIDEVEGTGAEGRVTVHDAEKASA